MIVSPGLKARPPLALPPPAPTVAVPTTGLTWRNIGPFRAGRVAAVAGAIGQPGVFYIGLPFGGVWKTTSGGTTWFPVFDAVTDISSIASIAVAPSDPDVVYAGTGDTYRAPYRGNGVYKSTDAGKTWRHLSLGDTKVPNLIVDPKDPNIVRRGGARQRGRQVRRARRVPQHGRRRHLDAHALAGR